MKIQIDNNTARDGFLTVTASGYEGERRIFAVASRLKTFRAQKPFSRDEVSRTIGEAVMKYIDESQRPAPAPIVVGSDR